MEIKCAWCDAIIGIKKIENEGDKIPLVTHSICKTCQKQIFNNDRFADPLGRRRARSDLGESPLQP